MSYRLRPEERLKNARQIDLLFGQGSQQFLYPFKIYYMPIDSPCHQLLVSTSKKRLKTAVKRNHIKRLVRESFRKNKHIIGHLHQKLAIALIFVGDYPTQSSEVESKIILILQRLHKLHAEIDR